MAHRCDYVAEMQDNYEHAVPVSKQSASKRKVLVFRTGQSKQCKDNGKQTTSVRPTKKKRVWYGHPLAKLGVSIGSLHSRAELSDLNVHE